MWSVLFLLCLSITSAIATDCDVPGSYVWPADMSILVAQDGSGNCTKIQSAINQLPWGYQNRYIINIKPGYYYEKIRINNDAPPLTLRGLTDSPDLVMLSYDDSEYVGGPPGCAANAGGEWDSQTIWIGSDDFAAVNISIRNNACNYTKGRNFAVQCTGDRASFYGARIYGGQDTFYFGAHRTYLRDCFLNGTVDFLFGLGAAVFDHCELQGSSYHVAHKGDNRSQTTGNAGDCDNTYPWQQQHALGGSCSAVLILNSTLTKPPLTSKGAATLGRPWRNRATVLYNQCWMDDHISPAGWDQGSYDCSSPPYTNCVNVTFAEFGSWGPGGNTSSRVPWSLQVTSDQAAAWDIKTVLWGWTPSLSTSCPEC